MKLKYFMNFYRVSTYGIPRENNNFFSLIRFVETFFTIIYILNRLSFLFGDWTKKIQNWFWRVRWIKTGCINYSWLSTGKVILRVLETFTRPNRITLQSTHKVDIDVLFICFVYNGSTLTFFIVFTRLTSDSNLNFGTSTVTLWTVRLPCKYTKFLEFFRNAFSKSFNPSTLSGSMISISKPPA